MASKIGIFGGTFNPVHRGHVRAVRECAAAAGLDRVIVMPAKLPPHKSAAELAADEHRLAMCGLAFSDTAGVTVSDLELTRGGKSYSVLTVRALAAAYPDARLYFIMGSDMLLSFESWYRWEELLGLCALLCLSRTDEDTQLVRKQAARLSAHGAEIVLCEAAPVVISSTKIREMLANGLDCSCYLPEKVVKYIAEHRLYGAPEIRKA
ncbi:MAG: nicotinate (nicotinamide) nucleotide adenylyltransferase [Oscillospiraceae bacterium]